MVNRLSSQQKTQVTEAYLARRLSRTQLCQMMETKAEQWDDTFESLTEHGNTASSAPSSLSIDHAVKDLGLVERYEKLHDDQVWSREERAIHRTIAHFDKGEPVEKSEGDKTNSGTFLKTVLTSFEEWDRNGDQRLDSAELDLAMSGGYFGEALESANDPQKAAALATLRRFEREVGSLDPFDGEGVSQTDLRKLGQEGPENTQRIHQAADERFQLFLEKAEVLTQKKPREKTHYDPSSILQGVPGSCVMLSLAATMKPTQVNFVVKAKPEGGYDVSFADGSSEAVPELTLAERVYHARTESGDSWPAALEVATAQKFYAENSHMYDSLREAIDGIEPANAMRVLLGSDIDRRELDELTVQQTRQALKDLTEKSDHVICASRPTAKGDFISVEDLDSGIQNGHAYSVLGYDSKEDTVTLRNPWGHTEWRHQQSEDDGVFDMPVRDFYANFRWMAGAVKPDNS